MGNTSFFVLLDKALRIVLQEDKSYCVLEIDMDIVPYSLEYEGDVGVYSYTAPGDRQYLCIVPVTEKRLKEYEKKGVKVSETGQEE